MRNETIAIHGGYDGDPDHEAVAVPIYQTVAYEFDSAEHGAALFNLEAEGFRYSRISNPTTDVLERRVAALEGGAGGAGGRLGPGGAALRDRSTSPSSARNIVSVPQLYGTTHTLFAHVLPQPGRHRCASPRSRPARRYRSADRRRTPAAVFCESVGNPAGNICDIEALAAGRARARRAADRRQHRGDADPAAADRVRRRYRRAFADQVHGRPRHHAGRRHRRQRQVSAGRSTPTASRCSTSRTQSYHGLVYAEHFGADAPISHAAAAFISAPPARCCRR